MVRFKQCLALAALVAVGCAVNPEIEEGGSLASAAPAATPTATDAAAQASAAVTPDLVVDVNDLAARSPPSVICRDVLRQNSNVIVTQCRTAANWKRFESAEAQQAAQIVRMMQGGAYR